MPGRRKVLAAGAALLLGCGAAPPPRDARAAWQFLPPTPVLPKPDAAGVVPVNGALLHFARYGHGAPVILLHGGLAHSAWWGRQLPALAARHEVILLDARGHGRSTLPAGPITYALLADDVAKAMRVLGIPRAAVVGWSDGGIAGLLLALEHPGLVTRLAVFGANFSRAGIIPGGSRSPVFAAYAARVAGEYRSLAPRPQDYPALLRGMKRMWQTEPEIPPARLGGLRMPVLVMAADHDEVIRRQHAAALAASIGSARLVLEPGVSHFAMLQDPARFNADLLAFLDDGG